MDFFFVSRVLGPVDLLYIDASAISLVYYASVRMRTAAYGSLFVCLSVCLCITAITAQRLKCKCK